MNRSWNKNSTASPGFVYFNQEVQKESDDTDFIPFQESPKQNYKYSPNYGSPKYHSSPRKYNRNNYRYSGGNRGNRSFYNPNCSNSSWHDQKQHKQNYHKKKTSFNNSLMMSADGKRDMSMFYDATCTKNPWEALEKEIESKLEDTDEIKTELGNEKVVSSKKDSSSSDEESSSNESTSSNQECEREETT